MNGRRARARIVAMLASTAAVLALVIVPSTAANAATATTGTGWLRFAHFAMGVGPVRVAVDGTLVDPAAAYKTVTPYRSVAAGRHVVSISGGGLTPRQEAVTIGANQAVTASAVEQSGGPHLAVFHDNLAAAPAGRAKVRIIDVEGVARTLAAEFRPDGQTTGAAPVSDSVFGIAAVPFGHASSYVAVPAGQYQVTVVDQAGSTVVAGSHWPVAAGTVASLVVLPSATGATLEVVSDAAGASVTPAGGMQTGFGGMAGATGSPSPWPVGIAIVVGVAAVAIAFGATRRRSTRALVATGTALVLATAVLTITATHGRARSNPREAASARSTATTTAAPTPRVRPAVDLAAASAAARPTRLRIASLGVDGPLVALGVNADGTAQVPSTADQIGWFADGPAPGQPGPAVVLGHVDSKSGPGVFYRLRELTRGAEVDVWDGAVRHDFRVERVETVAKSTFPTAAVFGPTPDRELRLVTCGGAFDRATGHYVDNVIVYATETPLAT
jgi:sortase (surface protein transpeptidase)